MLVNFWYGMLHCLCSGLVEVFVITQAQHINNRKYTDSDTINYECRLPVVYANFEM
jgi:hypothetical protein